MRNWIFFSARWSLIGLVTLCLGCSAQDNFLHDGDDHAGDNASDVDVDADGDADGDSDGDSDGDQDETDQFVIETAVDGQGGITLKPDLKFYEKGKEIQITASPSADWTFDHWSGDLEGEEPSMGVTIEGDLSITAHFVRYFKVNIDVAGEGEVIVDPDQFEYEEGTAISITAQPQSGWHFDSWSGGLNGNTPLIEMTLENELSATANFLENLTLTVQVEGEGTVTRDPDQDTYIPGDDVTLTASPSGDGQFLRWEGDLTSTESPTVLNMDDHKTVTAVFAAPCPVGPEVDDKEIECMEKTDCDWMNEGEVLAEYTCDGTKVCCRFCSS